MASKFNELMKNYGKVKQFPMDGPLMPLTEEQAASTQYNPSTKNPAWSPINSRAYNRKPSIIWAI